MPEIEAGVVDFKHPDRGRCPDATGRSGIEEPNPIRVFRDGHVAVSEKHDLRGGVGEVTRQVGNASATESVAVHHGDLDRTTRDPTLGWKAGHERHRVTVAVNGDDRGDRLDLGQGAIAADVAAVEDLVHVVERFAKGRHNAVVRVGDNADLQAPAQRIDFPIADRMSSIPRVPVLFRSSRIGFVSTQSMLIISRVSLTSSRAR